MKIAKLTIIALLCALNANAQDLRVKYTELAFSESASRIIDSLYTDANITDVAQLKRAATYEQMQMGRSKGFASKMSTVYHTRWWSQKMIKEGKLYRIRYIKNNKLIGSVGVKHFVGYMEFPNSKIIIDSRIIQAEPCTELATPVKLKDYKVKSNSKKLVVFSKITRLAVYQHDIEDYKLETAKLDNTW